MDAWLQADSSTEPAAKLDPWLEVQVLSRWGDWAYIRCTNGWSAWVDGRRLQPMSAPTAAQPAYAPQQQYAQQQPAYAPQQQYAQQQYAPVRQYAPRAAPAATGPTFNIGGRAVPVTLAMLGPPVILIGSLLPWYQGAGGFNGFDVPIKYLFSLEAAGESSLSLGLLFIAAAIGGALLLVLAPKSPAVRSVASATLGICVLFGVQTQRELSQIQSTENLLGVLSFGVYITVAGAVLLMLNMVPLGGRR